MSKIRPDYRLAIERSGILLKLAPFAPEIAGAVPLGLDIDDSDIDVLCFSANLNEIEQSLRHHFGNETDFSLRQWESDGCPVIARFQSHGWVFQIFGSATPVREQVGWALFQTELRLIKLGGQRFRAQAMTLRKKGWKTIPAIAEVLNCDGHPYKALLELHGLSDSELAEIVSASLEKYDVAEARAPYGGIA